MRWRLVISYDVRRSSGNVATEFDHDVASPPDRILAVEPVARIRGFTRPSTTLIQYNLSLRIAALRGWFGKNNSAEARRSPTVPRRSIPLDYPSVKKKEGCKNTNMETSSRSQQLFAYLLVFTVCSWLLPTTGSARTTSRISENYGFENGANAWTSLTADFASIHTIQQRDWDTSNIYGREGELRTNFLRVSGQGDFGQFVTLEGRSPHQILSCLAFKEPSSGASADSYAGFGITYYDVNFNELEVQQKPIGESVGNAQRGFGDGMVPYSIGLVVPPNARFAYIWIWNSDAANDVLVDKFELGNFMKDDDYTVDQGGLRATPNERTNAILNGSMDTLFNFDEYWQIEETFDTVYPASIYGIFNNGYFNRLRMGGTYNPNLIFQRVSDIQPGAAYDFTAFYERGVESGTLGSSGPPQATAGVDFFDANGNKIETATLSLQKVADPISINQTKFIETTSVTIPANASYAYAWVWVEPSGTTVEAPLILDALVLRRKNTNQPGVEFGNYFYSSRFDATIRNPGFKRWDIGFNIEDANQWFVVRGPNGFESSATFTGTSGGFSGLPFRHNFVMDTTPSASGQYEIVLQSTLRNGSGVTATSRVVHTFDIP